MSVRDVVGKRASRCQIVKWSAGIDVSEAMGGDRVDPVAG